MEIINIISILIIAYLFGSIPTGVWVSKIFFGFDIRTKGSGNTGSTNVFRVLGKKWGIIVQLVDILKAYIPVAIIAPQLAPNNPFLGFDISTERVIVQMLTGIFAVLGHMYPIFAKFKGGKGVNCVLGMLLGFMPLEAVIGLSSFIITFLLSGYVSLGSIIAGLVIPTGILIRKFILGAEIAGFELKISFAILLAILLIYTHRTNITRLRQGTESRFEKAMIFRKKSNNQKK